MHAPLNFTMKSIPPSHVPAPKPPGKGLSEEVDPLWERSKERPERYEHTRESIHPGVCIECRSSTTRL